MEYHDCTQDERIRNIITRVDKLEEKVDTIKICLKEIKDFQNKLMWVTFGGLVSSVGSLILLILKMKGIG